MGQALATLWALPLIGALGGMMYGLGAGEILIVFCGLLAAIPALALVAGFASALSAGVRRGGLLISLIALPLYVPTAIFGALAMTGGPGSAGASLFLAASTLFACAVAPYAMAAALRLAAD